ncbi:MAG: M56 family metallopeptidase, partial [Cyclobacteriaceae bacterium]
MMKAIAELLSSDWANALGWTLLHSIWQSLAILLIVIAVLRFIPTKFAGIRYAATSGGLFLFTVTVLWTFIYLIDSPAASPIALGESTSQSEQTAAETAMPSTASENTISVISVFIDANMPLIVGCWIAGFLFSVIRLTSGIYFTCRLRSTAIPLENKWGDYIKQAGRDLGVNRLVRLAESASISTPMVIGDLKPLIIIPMGMLTGLTTEQLETIFVHELAHIKRHDYLINFIQNLVETIFFFNPFIRTLSGWIRREREYCCDDVVVERHGGAKAYAHALMRLAEVRLLTPAFALPLADGKNHLLNRIRRIMEKSVKNYSTEGRMVIPAVLLVVGLLCVSWLGINPDNGYKGNPFLADQDTVKRNTERSARYSGKRINTPAIPDISAFPPVPDVLATPPIPDIDIQGIPDTIPPPGFPFHREFELKSLQQQLEQFQEFELKDLEQQLQRLQEFELKGLEQELEQLQEFESKDLEQQLQRLQEFELKGLEQELEQLQEFESKDLEQQLQRLQEFELKGLEQELEQLQ